MDAQVPPAQGGRASSRDLRRAGGVRPGQARQPLDHRVRRLYEGGVLLVARPGTGDDLPALGGDSAQRGSVEAVPLQRAQLPRNVAGKLPDGGKISWILDKEFCGKYWNPPRWKAGAGPRDGVLWTSQQTCGWTSWNLLPYIWLGGAERGLAWFADNDKGWILDNTAPCQTVSRENGKSVLRVYLVKRPAKLQGRRRIVFGLQASPTRPMPKKLAEHRSHPQPQRTGELLGIFRLLGQVSRRSRLLDCGQDPRCTKDQRD